MSPENHEERHSKVDQRLYMLEIQVSIVRWLFTIAMVAGIGALASRVSG